ncbi:MAG: hypothetical protein WBZ48_08185 [Bacteroidota bacterium]
MRKMTFVVESILAIMFLAGCDNSEKKELEKNYANMVTETALLHKDIDARDKYIDQIMESVNQIYLDLERAKSKESKLILNARNAEGKPKLASDEIRKAVLDQLAAVRSSLKDNGKRITNLQHKLSASTVKYASLEDLVASLKESIYQREQSITNLEMEVRNLQGTVAEKTREIGEKEAAIEASENTIQGQKESLNTVYYIAGTRPELEKKGIISKEGGFLWGLLGSTTVLSADADTSQFKPLDMTVSPEIHVSGNVAEILPRRSQGSFQLSHITDNEEYVMITHPQTFWRDKYLVIILD